MLNFLQTPVRRNLANPFNTGILHECMRIKASGYGLLDQYLLALFKPFDLALFDLYSLAYINKLTIQVIRN